MSSKVPARTRSNAVRLLVPLPLIAAALSGCAQDSASSAIDVVQADDGESRVHSLLLLVDLQMNSAIRPELVPHTGQYLHRSQIDSLSLKINGRPWGTFINTDRDTTIEDDADEALGWTFTSTPSTALFVADLRDQEATGRTSLDTVGDWVDLLSRYLGPGGYVAELDEIVVRNADEISVSYEPELLFPFDVGRDEETAYIGHATIQAPELGR